jgi:hypothetical protein
MVEAVRRALTELGEVSNEELAAYVQDAFGVSIRPNFMPVLRAAVRDKENLEARKRRSAEAAGPGPSAPASAEGQRA